MRDTRSSRRAFIARAVRGTALGVGTFVLGMREAGAAPAAALGMPSTSQYGGDVPAPVRHGAEPRGLDLPAKDRAAEGRFGLMFKHLPAFAPPDELLTRLAAEVTDVSQDASEDILNGTPLAPPPGDSTTIPSGFTFLGQFIDHDLTFDATPIPEQQVDPDAVRNFRSARYDLDSLYTGAPRDPVMPAKLLVEPNVHGVLDVPRSREDGRALIGDPRNDENLIICQLHVAFLKFHNVLVDQVVRQGIMAEQAFEEAQRLTRWHFQWVVVHDFLPRVAGRDAVDAALDERGNKPPKVKLDFFKPKNPNKPMLPVEFAAAAYRFGHSMVRRRYTMSKAGVVRDEADVKALIFGVDRYDRSLLGYNAGASVDPAAAPLQHLAGARPIPPELVIQWSNLFEVKGALGGTDGPRPVRKIDGRLSFPLGDLPRSALPRTALAEAPPVTSLAARNLLRGKRLGLPAGQQVAREMGVPEPDILSNERLDRVPTLDGSTRALGLTDPRWGGQAPLWFYILREAELLQGGERLGPVGGRIVAEVLLGLLERDRTSYLGAKSAFRPLPPIAPAPGRFSMADLLKVIGAS